MDSESSQLLQQRMMALHKANMVRMSRSLLKKELQAGRVPIEDLLLADLPEWLESMKIIHLLLATPKNGRVRVNKVLRQCEISPSRRLGDLTMRERAKLISKLR